MKDQVSIVLVGEGNRGRGIFGQYALSNPLRAAFVAVTDAARGHPGIFVVCYQMRYMLIFHAIKQIVASGRYGGIVNVEHSENVSFQHMAHTFARGVFNNDAVAPMILAKPCHDMDWLQYLIATKPLRIASCGGLALFRPENAPE